MESIVSGLAIMKCPTCALTKVERRKQSLRPQVVCWTLFILSVVASVHVTSSESSSTTSTKNLSVSFINGLANSIRRIQSTQLAAIARHEPFMLQFRTACPSSNLIYNEKFSIHINSDGNLSYTKKETNESQVYRNVVDGQWHSLIFNGSSILIQEPHYSTDSENALTKDSSGTTIVTYHSNNAHENEHSVHDLLNFFDGFVGCVRVNNFHTNNNNSSSLESAQHDHHQHSTNGKDIDVYDEFAHGSDGDDEDGGHHELNATSLFQLFNTYPGCIDEHHDLRDSHHCHNPESFVYCAKCKGKCVEIKGGGVADQNSKHNECNCTHLNTRGKYCDIPVTETAEPGRSALLEFVSHEPDSEPTSTHNNTISVIGGKSGNVSVISDAFFQDNSLVTTSTPSLSAAVASPVPSDAPVSSCPCENGGTCTNSTAGRTCHCAEGFDGEHCQYGINECSPSRPCRNGICSGKQCYCTPGYTGDFCEVDIDECSPMRCSANSTVRCLNLVNKFTCVCVEGFTSKLCDVNIDECESNPCQNSATCLDQVNDYQCICLPGFEGRNCQINIDECLDNGTEPKCMNGGQCLDKINGFDCNCTGTGFEGPQCENNVDDCLPGICQHGSTCVDKIKGYTCDCHSGYAGDNCENDTNECEIPDETKPEGITSPCKEGICFEHSNESLYYSSAWEGAIPSDFNREFSYENASGFYCMCPPGFAGQTCEINLNECLLPDGRSPCVNGKCIDGRNNYTCECSPGYTSRNCDVDINECLSNPCAKGRCVDKVADFECICPEGYGSKNCSIKLTGCETTRCLNDGGCRPYYENNEQRFSCTCLQGYSGSICEVITTMSFNGSNYVTVASNDENYRSAKYEMQFRFKTTLSNVLVAVGQGITYFMLTLSDGRLNLQSSLLNSLNGISSGTNLSNAEYHKVWISVNDTHIALAANSEQTIHPISENQEPGDTGFNMTVLGGATPTLNSLNKENLGFFVGCVQDVVINGQSVNAEEKNVNVTLVQGVMRGCHRKEQCSVSNEVIGSNVSSSSGSTQLSTLRTVGGPCLNGGICTDLWQKYQCHCTRPFLGSRCEFQYKPGTFGNEKTTTSIAEVHISPEVSRKFSNSFDISMFVRTRESRGTIFFLGDESREGGLFLEAQVEEDGQLGVVSKLDEIKEETYTVGGLQINDGIAHLINVQKEKGLVKISINGTEHFRKSVKEKVQFNPTIMFVGGVLPNISDVNDTNDFEDSTVIPGMEIPTRPVPTINSLILSKMKPFKGVIQDVRVNLSATDVAPTASSHDHFVVEFFPLEVPLDYSMGQSLGNVTLYGDVLEGVVSDETCVSNPCLNGGTCEVTWNDFQCHCEPGVYDGKTCEQMLRCAMVTCPENSVCRNIGSVGFECVAEAAFDGRRNVSPHYQLKNQRVEPLSFQKVSFRYRSRTGGSVMHLASRNASVRIALELEYEESSREGISNSTNFVSVYLNGNRHNVKVDGALDGDWHNVELGFDNENHLNLYFGGMSKGRVAKDNVLSSNLFNDIILPTGAQIVIGSHVRDGSQYEIFPDSSPTRQASTSLTNHPESLHDSFFRGCLGEVKIGNYELPFVSPDQLYALNRNKSLVETTAPTAFYIDSGSLTPNLGCVLCYDSECKNGGRCANAPENYDCSCSDGFEGARCEKNIDECLNNECAHGSICVDQIANYTCNCRAGTTGWLCDVDIDECSIESNGKFISPCKNGGLCINLAAEDGFYKCNCTDDYFDTNCEKRKLSTCQKNNEPCEHGGICRTIPMRADGVSFKCDCPTGYDGITCGNQINYCEKVFCENGGTCKNALVGFQCLCMPGWDGPKCNIDKNECALSYDKGEIPCENNGTCIDGLNEFTCDCSHTGFEGEHCEIDIDECANETINASCRSSVPKVCVNLPGTFECRCEVGLCGRECDVEDPCLNLANDTCANGGLCVPLCDEEEPRHSCQCTENFEGERCLVNLSMKRHQTLNIALIVIPVLTAFLLAVVIAIFVLVKMARKKRATRGVYSPSQQEYCNPRVQLDNIMKPPPEERLI